MRKNPIRGKHPDLFGGETGIYVPLEELSREELAELTRDQFNDIEWGKLDAELKAQIYQNRQWWTLDEMLFIDEPEVWVKLKRDVRRKVLQTERVEELIEKLLEEGTFDRYMSELDEVIRDEVLEEVEILTNRRKELVELFVDAYNQALEPDDDYVISMVDDSYALESFLREKADHLVEEARRKGFEDEVDDALDHVSAFANPDTAETYLDEVLQDADYYGTEVSDDEYSSEGMYKECITNFDWYVEGRQVDSLLRFPLREESLVREIPVPGSGSPLTDVEVEKAIEEINYAADDMLVTHWGEGKYTAPTPEDLRDHVGRSWSDLSGTVESPKCVVYRPDWERVKDALYDRIQTAIDDEEIDPVVDLEREAEVRKRLEQSYEDRIVYRFPDGFYVLELAPEELEEEGNKMGFCIGQEQYGYPRAVRSGRGRAFSLRAPSGKRKLTLFARLDKDGEITEYDQVKGKANRLPGWDAGKVGTSRFKIDEVKKAMAFILSTGANPMHDAPDLEPAIGRLVKMKNDGDKEAAEIFDRSKMSTFGILPEGPERNPAPHAHSCPTCSADGVGFCRPFQPTW